MEQEKLLKWCNENFNFDTQKWEYKEIPSEILDYVIVVMKNWWTNFDDEWTNDFIDEFICSEIVSSKYWTITKMWLKSLFNDETKHLFD